MPENERNSLRKRAARYAKVSTTMAGFGARVGGKKILGLRTDRQEDGALLRLALGALKGPLMKVAQIAAMIPDLVPKEYADELAQLQADAPSMGWPFVKRRMSAELGVDWEKKFKKFSQKASAAASLGQVHRAVGLDGRELACKLQYPDMASAVEADLGQLKIFLALFERYDQAVDTKEIQNEIAERLREELDYLGEARNIKLYRKMLADEADVHVPEVVDALSTDRLLTMTWLEGQRLVDVAEKRSLQDRNAVATNMFRAWYKPFYKYGVLHGDPHMGNYTIREDNSLNLLDFGCIRVFEPAFVEGVITLYHALLDKKPELAVEAYKTWGFHNPSKALVGILNIWAQFVYAPLLEDRTRRIEETNTGLYGKETAARMHRELRKIGGITIPREFVFMDRAAIGLGSVFLRLQTELNWHRLFEGLINDFKRKNLEVRQMNLLNCGF